MCSIYLIFNLFILSILNIAHGHAVKHHTHHCDRPWPYFEMFVPIQLSKNVAVSERALEYDDIFLKSFLLFWPHHVSKPKIVFVGDGEDRGSKLDTRLHARLKELATQNLLPPAQVKVMYNEPNIYYGARGYDRQQIIMFYAENYTNAELVGFTDTDCMFHTYVDRDDLFENGKPVINARKYGWGYEGGYWSFVPQVTQELLGFPTPIRCMAWFPVIFYVKHIIALRKYMEERYGLPFYEVFLEHMVGKNFAQFDMMCAFFMRYFPDDYSWYMFNDSPKWNGTHPPPLPGVDTNMSHYSFVKYTPKLRPALHARYHLFGNSPLARYPMDGPHGLADRTYVWKRGICFSPPFSKPQYPFCDDYRTEHDYQTNLNTDMMIFEDLDYNHFFSKEYMQNVTYERFRKIRYCNWTINQAMADDLMQWEVIPENRPLFNYVTQKQILIFYNNSFFRVGGWDVMEKYGWDKVPMISISAGLYWKYPTVGTVPNDWKYVPSNYTRLRTIV